MEISKQHQADARQVYELFWESYLKGDEKAFASTLDDSFEMIGTSETEIAHGKAQGLDFYKSQVQELDGKAQLRNRQITFNPIDGLILINELADIYALVETGWIFYSKLRLSTFLRLTGTGWKVVQQHGSLPDARVKEGETVAFEKISKENLELRDAVKRRTVELENKTRELEIESSLERVRTVAMGMRKPDDMLEVCRIISQQSESLGIKEIRNVQTAIIYENKGTYLNFEYYAKHDKLLITEVDYKNHKLQSLFANRMLQGAEELFAEALTGKEVLDWYEYQKTTNQFADRFLKSAQSLNYYFYSLGPVALGMSAYAPLSDQEINLFKRFRNVFDLAYRRFLDIEQAEAQAREAKIEASLERVRAQALSMHKPDDLPGICEVLFNELLTLGFAEIRNAMINIHNDEKASFVNYDYSDEIGQSINHLAYNIHPLIEKQIKQIRSAGDAFSETSFKGKDLEDMISFRKKIGEKDDPRIKKSDGVYYYFYSIGTGSIGISTFSSIAEEKLDVLKRFRNVFDFAYRRYTDVAQAEAQAREAQIEVAVERVRAQSMAMHHPDDLDKVNKEILVQLTWLQVPGLTGVTFYLIDEYGWVKAWDLSSPGNLDDPNSYVLQFDSKKYQLIGEPFRILQQSELDYFIMDYPIKKLERAVKELVEINPSVANAFKEAMASGKLTHQWNSCARLSNGIFGVDLVNPPTEDTRTIMLKMAGAFNQAYQRFLDLQKAEAQAREAQIELGLERVRARAMAMQNSNELADLVATLFKELIRLDFALTRCYIYIIDPDSLSLRAWTFNTEIDELPESYYIKYLDLPYYKAMINAWKERNQKFVYELGGEEKQEVDRVLLNETEYSRLPEAVKSGMMAADRVFLSYSFNNFGGLQTGGLEPLSDENLDIFSRFGKVFDLTYTRFNDLKQAEAQAREAQIELALERVRARTMRMQQSSELAVTASLLFQQVKMLGVEAFSCGFNFWNKGDKECTSWMSSNDGGIMPPIQIPLTEDPNFIRFYESMQNGETFYELEMVGEALQTHFRFLRSFPAIEATFKKLELAGIKSPVKQIHNIVNFSHGNLMFITLEPCPEAHEIFIRFAKVFEQTYTRFLDLQKAEAQSREAQIEAALERVRSRSIGMQKSEELKEVIQIVYEQFVHLNILIEHTGFIMDYKERNDMNIWLADQHKVPSQITIPYFDSPHWNSFIEAKVKGLDFFVNHLTFEEKNRFYHDLFKLFPVPDEAKEYYFNCPGLAISTVLLENVGLYIENFSGIPFTEEENATLMRFGKVFQQTYTRFLDLQKAEAQAREARIEAALERIRSRALAMHNSSEVGDVSDLLFSELENMDINPAGFSIMVFDREQDRYELWRAKEVAHQGVYETLSIKAMYDKLDQYIPGFTEELESEWNSGSPFFIAELRDKKRMSFIQANRDMGNYTEAQFENVLRIYPDPIFWHLIFFKHGWLGLIYDEQLPADDLLVIRRFADVFEFAHTRFLDLQNAESQAREAQIEAALERVRSRTMAMQKSDELAETSAVLFQQLIQLGIEPNRLYITIIKDDQANAEFWITDEDGSKVSSAFETNLNNNPVFRKMLNGWKGKKNSLTIDMKGEELQVYFQYLSSLNVPFKGGLAQTRRIQYLGYFNKGFIGMASPVEQPEETIQLLVRFAAVFNLTFTRFNDLKIAEAHAIQAEEDLVKLQTEKQRAEEALAELQVTQKQLIQAEKMASLGELTAGIAHEIQNPLNFVNNFSEVSNELLDEMKLELDRGDTEEAKAIASDVKLNLEKILHHGKRADAIVKGMLQHSRSSSGVKEPTDINALADEYLRLAYHGLRAKDKSFNATLKTDFDESIGKIDVIPQDIGRVILNLITNAFYAVDEKKKQQPVGYEPTVSISTIRSLSPGEGRGEVKISVKDNGPGIPPKVLDKIFQPFFTTKPTGEGTGLGLSLSYDIVKAHGGELNAETKEGEGSVFTIQLPA